MERKPEDEQMKAERNGLANGGADGRRKELKHSRGTWKRGGYGARAGTRDAQGDPDGDSRVPGAGRTRDRTREAGGRALWIGRPLAGGTSRAKPK